ncbi:hypothetical protein B566_EDAN015745, partial [Ephemera danica]
MECHSDGTFTEPAFIKTSARKQFAYQAAKGAAQELKDEFIKRTASQLWDMDSFDPFQIFEVTQRKCNILHVNVLRGSNVTKGWFNDIMDTPDPYLILSVAGTPNGKKRTKTIDNCTNPVWDERFQFFLDPSDKYQLNLVFMDANYTLDEEMGRCTLPLDDLKLDTEVEKIATFENGSKIYMKLKIVEDDKPDLRYSLALSEDEKQYLRERRLKVPVIGMLGSGGGFRAMTCLSGVCNALYDEGIMDCIMYMSYLYSHPEFPEHPPANLQSELRDRVSRDWRRNLLPNKLIPYTREILAKV